MSGGQDFQARVKAAQARFDADAMIGRTVAEATRYYQERDFVVMVEQAGGPSVLSHMAERVRLGVRDGLFVEARLG
jgi:hypothetical protein